MTTPTHELFSEVLLRNLVNIGTLTQTEAGRHVVKSLNILMLKVLENADRTSSFFVLLKLLIRSDQPGFVKLVIKCLLKITKALPTTIDSRNVDRIMRSLDEFFEMQNRAPARFSDTCVRAVKGLLNEIVKLKRKG